MYIWKLGWWIFKWLILPVTVALTWPTPAPFVRIWNVVWIYVGIKPNALPCAITKLVSIILIENGLSINKINLIN